MTEKPQENQPSSNFDRLTPQEQSAALSRFLEAEAEKKNGAAAERLKNRDFFPQPADATLSEQVIADVVPLKKPVETLANPISENDEEVEELIERMRSIPNDKDRMNMLMSDTAAGKVSPSAATEALAQFKKAS